jgi:RNA polymerase sigma-70 factor (ECF subfamily)
MSPIAEKYQATIDEAVERLLTRAEKARGVTAEELRPRVLACLEKYIFSASEQAERSEIREFVDGIRADDLCLILACERGDSSAWDDLVSTFDATVKSAARKMTQSSEDAEDLAGSIWAELYGLRQNADGKKKSKLTYYSGRGSLAGWLRAVVSQLAIDEFRKQSKFVQVEEDREFEALANEAAAGDNHHFVSRTENPEDAFTESQTSADVIQALQSAIAELDAEDRLIMKLYYFDDLKLKDIANTFGYHEATASRRLARVQAVIRKGVERDLKSRHGWTDGEVKRYLSDTATGLGINLETMFAVLMLVAVVQDFWS